MTISAGPITIAIDGPSGSGKSSVSREVARRLGVGYLDTGAMYRALAWWCAHRGIDTADLALTAAAAADFPLVMAMDPDDRIVRVGDHDVTDSIRTTEISYAVSAVATNLQVRPVLQQAQRDLIATARRTFGGVVAEGRDLTTVVAPDAEIRILLTASQETRLARRSIELHGGAGAADVAATREQVVNRDAIDATHSQFTTAADGVVQLDSSDLDFEGSVAAVLGIVERHRASMGGPR